jgi:DNA invertase Pin-like site-specific DNA recombinase
MASGGFISYLRVSTTQQGDSGLGLAAQRAEVARYLNGGDWRIIAEFVEVESGRSSDRPVLAQALAAARLHRVPLVVRQSRPANALPSLPDALNRSRRRRSFLRSSQDRRPGWAFHASANGQRGRT